MKLKVYEFKSQEEFESSEVCGQHNVIAIVRGNGMTCMDAQLDMKYLKRALEKMRESLKDYHEFDGWFDGFIEEYESCGEIASYSGIEDQRQGCWSYSYGIERGEDSIYIFINLKDGKKEDDKEMEKRLEDLYARAMERGDSEATAIEHLVSLKELCEETTDLRGDDARMWAIERYNDEIDAQELREAAELEEKPAPKMAKALPISVYKSDRLGDCTNGGISSRYRDLLLLCDDGYIDVDLNNPPENLVKVVEWRPFGDKTFKHIEPYAKVRSDCVGWMSGGNIAYSEDSRFRRMSEYPLSIHDRQETQEHYDLLTND